MLLDKEDVLELLRCPRSGSRLQKIGNELVADSGTAPARYDIIDDFPVLVDFNNSLLQKENIRTLGSVVERRAYHGFLGAAKRLASPPRSVLRIP